MHCKFLLWPKTCQDLSLRPFCKARLLHYKSFKNFLLNILVKIFIQTSSFGSCLYLALDFNQVGQGYCLDCLLYSRYLFLTNVETKWEERQTPFCGKNSAGITQHMNIMFCDTFTTTCLTFHLFMYFCVGMISEKRCYAINKVKKSLP